MENKGKRQQVAGIRPLVYLFPFDSRVILVVIVLAVAMKWSYMVDACVVGPSLKVITSCIWTKCCPICNILAVALPRDKVPIGD